MSTAEVLAERRGAVAVLTLNRPDRLNAITPSMHRRYRALLAEAEADAGVGAIVVTGAGRGFCAGADSDAVAAVAVAADGEATAPTAAAPPPDRPGYGSHPAFDRPFAYHLGLAKPVVAAVNGPAAGLGLVLACFCDVRFAAPGAKLTSAFGPLGLPVEYGLSWLLPRLVGGARANELLLSSRVVLAEEAAAIGLVHRVSDPGAVVDDAVAWAQDVVERCAPGALAQTKRQLYADWMAGLGAAYDDALAATRAATAGPEFREAVAARRERRPPRWRDGA